MVRTSFAQPLWSASLFLTVPPFIVETARIVRCSLLHSLWRFLTAVLAHHEFFDGTGYPRGLSREQIPLGARIISIANTFDTMLSDCPYRNALSMSHARGEIRRCGGTQFDPKIVEGFLSIPEVHWIELRECLGSPFRLTHARNMGFAPH